LEYLIENREGVRTMKASQSRGKCPKFDRFSVLNDNMVIPGENIMTLKVFNGRVSRNPSGRKIPPRRDHDRNDQTISPTKMTFAFSPWPVPDGLTTFKTFYYDYSRLKNPDTERPFMMRNAFFTKTH
jgi:hypothetical protein